ncbi:hypothetical protein MKX03_027198 [Papaver bracteatum]|nr:hypothetical protein MKX03_027198 [Papaver bracteatum]
MERGLETRETMSTKEKVEEEEEEEEEGEKICRICHSPGDSENPLQYPCACSGSMKFVHPKCLLHWMKQRNTFECEFLIINVVLIRVPFLLGRIILHCLSWLFFGALSIFMPFIESTIYIENKSLKKSSHAVTNLSAEIQNNGLLSCAIEVVAETLTANSTEPGEALSSVGKPLLVDPSSGLYFVITLATGYMVVAPLVFVCFGIPIRTIASKIRYYLRKFLTTMINPFVLIIHLGVIPSAYGWWLDNFFSKFPLLSSSMHWMVGIIYMCQINISISQVRRVLRRGVLCFLHDLADPIDIILGVLIDEVQVSQLFSIVVNGILIVFLVYFPGVLAMGLAPTIFPLHISVPDPFTEIPVVMLLLQICFPYAIELWGTVEALLHQWVTTVCCFLGLSFLLSSRPEDIGGQENVKVERQQERLRDGLIAGQDPDVNISTSQNFDGVENYASDAIDNGFTFVHRVVLLVVLAWITLLLFNSSMIIVSLQLGRAVFSFISNLPITRDIKCNDLYAFFIGNFSIWTSFTGAIYFIEHFKAGKAHLRFSDICKLLCLIAESCVLSSLWIIVIPVLIGLLFEFCFMLPVRALVVEAPVLLLRQNWAVGFFFFKLWRTLVLMNHRIVLVDESWRIKFERVRDNGFLKLPGNWMLQELLIPIIMKLLMSLCFPYVFARWIVPLLGFSHIVNSAVYQFTWLAYVTMIVLFSCAKRFPVWIINLHNSMRDDHYSGLGLQNFGDVPKGD